MLPGRRARTRTWDPLLRRQMLYPTELRARTTLIVEHRRRDRKRPGGVRSHCEAAGTASRSPPCVGIRLRCRLGSFELKGESARAGMRSADSGDHGRHPSRTRDARQYRPSGTQRTSVLVDVQRSGDEAARRNAATYPFPSWLDALLGHDAAGRPPLVGLRMAVPVPSDAYAPPSARIRVRCGSCSGTALRAKDGRLAVPRSSG